MRSRPALWRCHRVVRKKPASPVFHVAQDVPRHARHHRQLYLRQLTLSAQLQYAGA